MQNINDFIREKGIILIVILSIGAIIFVEFSDRKGKNKREELKLNGGFAIGMVNSIGYSFAINSKKFRGVIIIVGGIREKHLMHSLIKKRLMWGINF